MTALALPGFHPDPSICRVGEDYFLVTSTFEYFPGVPIFAQPRPRLWRQLGNVLDRPSQLNVRTGIDDASGGIYAPTVRHHDGRFWMTTTNIHDIARRSPHRARVGPGRPVERSRLHRRASSASIPTSAWDDDGLVLPHLVGRRARRNLAGAGRSRSPGSLLTTAQEIWRGTGGAHAEGPAPVPARRLVVSPRR